MRNLILVGSILVTGLGTVAEAQTDPSHQVRIDYFPHNNGQLQIWLVNRGLYGVAPNDEVFQVDPLTGEQLPRGLVYPRRSEVSFGPILLWIGGLVDGVPLVSQGWEGELLAPVDADDVMRFATIDPSRAWFDSDARSELDLFCEYTDTFPVHNQFGNDDRDHKPLDLWVRQRSMSWRTPGVDDFILVELELTNIGSAHIEDIFIGLEATAGAAYWPRAYEFGPFQDDLAGFLDQYVFETPCPYALPLALAYGIDNDGDPVDGPFSYQSALSGLGMMFLELPTDSFTTNFNWWGRKYGSSSLVINWGPMKLPGADEPRPPRGMGTNFPFGDVQRYYAMSRPEVDYDQIFAAQNHSADGWAYPDGRAVDIADGIIPEMLLSAGSFDLPPGTSGKVVFAIVAGDNVHTDPTNFERNFIASDPSAFYANLNFSELATNARMAGWVYDNPGVDTDGDGYFGEFRLCDGDTLWYKGDGIPDFRADVPPPAPLVRIIPDEGRLTIRWNGYYSETAIDPFTRQRDFEGYRVYMGLDKRESSLSLISQYDYPNYNRYVMRQRPNGTWDWQNKDLPFTLDSLRQWLNEPDFEPLLHPRAYPFQYQDTFYYFETQSYNADLAPDKVHKVYPDAVKPPDDTLQWTADMLTDEHGKPLPKYYEYEYVLNKLLPTIEYYASVTAFDFGFAFGGIPSREASKYANITNAYAIPSAQTVASEHRDVYIWPNPYRYDGNYLEQGFENHDQSLWYDRARRIHFGNLPAKCTISILSLDGDLIKEIHHSFPPDDPEAQHDSFDLISRAGLLVVSGIYYWVVEGGGRTQMGKLVIIE